MKAGPMIARDYAPAFALKHMKKDLDLITRNGLRYGLDLPMAGLMRGLYAEAMAAGLGEKDFCAIVEMLEVGRTPQASEVTHEAPPGGNDMSSARLV